MTQGGEHAGEDLSFGSQELTCTLSQAIKANEGVMGNGEWHWDTCCTLHHTCVKQRIN